MPRPRQENQVRQRGFPAAFRPPAFASWASCPARGFRPSYDRPTAPPAGGADPSGVSMFRTRETRPGPDALCTPGTAVPARPRMHPAAACRPFNGRSLSPRYRNPSRDVFLTRHQQGFTGIHPSRPFPSPVAPGRNGNPWALPWASHPAEQDPAAHARAGTSLRHWPGITPSPSATSLSGPTQHERHHVAMHLESAPRTRAGKDFEHPHCPSSGALFTSGTPSGPQTPMKRQG
jgi:hypothetical protein